MRFVPVKTADSQAALMLVGVRDRLIRKTGFKLGRYSNIEFDSDRAAIEADLRELLGLDEVGEAP